MINTEVIFLVGLQARSYVTDRGKQSHMLFFILSQEAESLSNLVILYMKGWLCGEHNRDIDINANPCKEKKLTNIRAAARDENVILTPVIPVSLEKAINFIAEDEMVEVTPKSIRIRKGILSAQERHLLRGRKKVA